MVSRRSREGAWIEILKPGIGADFFSRRSREGAWIEISNSAADYNAKLVAPARERGLKFTILVILLFLVSVAPARERGLKCP